MDRVRRGLTVTEHVKAKALLEWLRNPAAQLPVDSIFGVHLRAGGLPFVRADLVDTLDPAKFTDPVEAGVARAELVALLEESERRGMRW